MTRKNKRKSATTSHLHEESPNPKWVPSGTGEMAREGESDCREEKKQEQDQKKKGESSCCEKEPEAPSAEDNSSEAADTRPSQRPPIPIEHGMWVPSLVETNGEGRVRLMSRWGDPMVEVFDITVDLCGMTKTTKTYGNVHGNISIDCTAYRVDLFNCDKESAVMIQQKGSLPLKDLDVALLGYDPIYFIVSLKIDDDELCDDYLRWNPSYACNYEWLLGTLKGKSGSVHVTYAVMDDSWLAELDVKLIKSTKETISTIYGDIVVYINNMRYLRYFAFSKRSDDCFVVKSLQPVPLSRSLFFCPHGSSLAVKVNLWDSDTNKPLACGTLLFPTEYYGETVGTVSGQCGTVQIKVNWGHHTNHSKTREVLKAIRLKKKYDNDGVET